MPYTARKRQSKWRVVKVMHDGRVRIAKNSAGTAVDGGGHRSRKRAMAQARAIMASESGYLRRQSRR